MRAVIYENSKRKWATDDGAWLIALPVGAEILHPDESAEIPGGGGPPNVRARVVRVSIDLSGASPLIELHVEELVYGGPGCNV